MKALDRRIELLEDKVTSGSLDPEKHRRRAATAEKARRFLEELDRGLHPDADPELVRLYRIIDRNCWRNQCGGLDAEFVRRRHEETGPIAEVWTLTYEAETLRLPEDRVRLEEIALRHKELYGAADAALDAALVTLNTGLGEGPHERHKR